MIPQPFIQDLLARTDIAEVVGRHVELKRGGANLMGLCPFHGEKSPSFSVSPSKQFYYCFGCGASGDAIGFLTNYLGVPFIDAVRDLAQQVGMAVPEDDTTPQERERAQAARLRQSTLTELLARAGEHYRKQLKLSDRAIGYLKNRGLTGEVAARFGIGFAPDGWRGLAGVFPRYDDPMLAECGLVIVQGDDGEEQKRYDRFRDRIMFPIRSVQGDVIGFGGRVLDDGQPKYLNSPETPVFVKGRELYGLFEARQALRERGYALVVEGYMDVVALAQLGFPNAVATLGTACTEEHVRKLLRFTDAVVFSFDGDGAGRRAAGRALEAALAHASDTRSIKFLFLPPEHDPDSFVRQHGTAAFEAAVGAAVPLSRQLLDVAREGCDLADAEGRAKFLAQAKPLWSALPTGALQGQLLRELAREAQLDIAELQGLWRMQPPRPASGPTPVASVRPRLPRHTLRGAASVLDRAVWLLLARSDLWSGLDAAAQELLVDSPPPHGDFFGWLDRRMHDDGPLSPQTLLAELRAGHDGTPLAALVQRVSGLLAMPHDTAAARELELVVDRLRRHAIEAELEHLAAAPHLSPETLQHMRTLRSQSDDIRRRLQQALTTPSV